MNDPRNTELAKVFVEHSTKVKKGDNVVISTSDLEPMDIIKETYKLCLQKGANVYLDIMGMNYLIDRSSYGDLRRTFYKNASEEQIKNPSEIYGKITDWGDKFIRITSFDNFSHLSDVDGKKLNMNSKAYHEWFRRMIDNKDWLLTYYPTPAMAERAGMSTDQLIDFYFNSTLVDYEEMKKRGEKVSALMDEAKEIRIIGDRTDLTINVEGRLARNSSGGHNIPDGETFLAPVHEKTEGHIYYEFPFAKNTADIAGAYLEFEKGKVVKATAEQGEDVLKNGLDIDEGARFLGELGIGLNYGITKPMKNTIFDEKMGGTVHVTLGEAYTYERGGNPDEATRNKSGIHWDLVKDMRKPGSKIEIDGEVKFKEGEWLV
jgi:aminopeptidase